MTKITFQVEIEIKEITYDPSDPNTHYIYCNKPKLLWEALAQRLGWKRRFKNLGQCGITLIGNDWNQTISAFPILKSFPQKPDPI